MAAKNQQSLSDRTGSRVELAYCVNGATVAVSATTLDRLLAELGYGDARVATAVNGAFVAVSARTQTTLGAGDRIEIVAPRQGG